MAFMTSWVDIMLLAHNLENGGVISFYMYFVLKLSSIPFNSTGEKGFQPHVENAIRVSS